jgi:hypothetical protein
MYRFCRFRRELFAHSNLFFPSRGRQPTVRPCRKLLSPHSPGRLGMFRRNTQNPEFAMLAAATILNVRIIDGEIIAPIIIGNQPQG